MLSRGPVQEFRTRTKSGGWDEPYKLTYREYVHNQAGKDAGIY